MTPLRAKMIDDMPLARLAPKTQAAYVTAVSGLATFYHRSPDQLGRVPAGGGSVLHPPPPLDCPQAPPRVRGR